MKQAPLRKPVTVEDLLRVKRAERPTVEFWSAWQKETRGKLQIAMSEKRPWWRSSLPRIWIAVARWHVPVGATALAALAFFSVREYQPAIPGVAVSAPVSFSSASGQAARETSSSALLTELRQDRNSAAETAAFVPGEVARSVAMLAPAEETHQLTFSPAARAIADNLAHARSFELELSLESRDSSAFPRVAPVEEPLSRVPTTRDMKRDRIMASYQPGAYSSGGTGSSRQQDRIVSRLNEDQLYETAVSRVGARGDRFSVKF
ncbi:MAG: hypothetical protein WC378_18530 [Opitutaceae bacterium]|jgi:hypothetical protein